MNGDVGVFTGVDQWGGGSTEEGLCSSQAEVKGQVGLAHLLSVHRVELFIHGHREDVLPQTRTTCRRDAQGQGGMSDISNTKEYLMYLTLIQQPKRADTSG